jgi:hypothetical protein
MKLPFKIGFLVLAAPFLLGPPAVMATESVVFLDDDEATFLPNAAAWKQSTFFPQTYGQGYHYALRNGSVLTAGPYLRMVTPVDLDESGGGISGTSGSQYQAYVRWSSAPNRCNNVRVEVRNFTDNTLITSGTFDQSAPSPSNTLTAFNWTPVGGRFTAQPNDQYEIRVYANNTLQAGGGINCVATVDGAAFFQQTHDSSDTFNLTRFSIVDEAGGDFAASSDNEEEVTGTDEIVKSVSITAPTSGKVIVNASGYFRFGSTSTVDGGRCSITTGSTVDFGHLIIADENQANTMDYNPFAATRGFNVSAGTTTFRLVCDSFSGTVRIGDPTMTAIYVPTTY